MESVGQGMDLQLRDRVAIVTGASRGIGLAASGALTRAGARLVMVARDAETLKASASSLARDTQVEVVTVAADVAQAGAAERIVEAAVSRFGRVDILVSNAGGRVAGSIESTSEEVWRSNLDLNLFALVRLGRLLVPRFKEQQWGRIIAVAALSVRLPRPGQIVSNASRVAMLAVCKTLAQEVAAFGTTVNCVCPGRIRTSQIQRAMSEEDIARVAATEIPARRFGEPEEVGDLIAFLASPRAAYITGNAITVDGGLCGTLT